jgi:cytochrome c biogenesis protein CcdA
MALLILSFIAGVLTVAAPCILPLLPVIIGGSLVTSGKEDKNRELLKPVVITISLAISIVVFTLLLKATTALLGIPQSVWQIISGVILLILGLNFLWPLAWEKFSASSGLFNRSNQALGQASQKKGVAQAILIGAALGPVFNSCSPTYALIVAAVLPVSLAQGLVYLIAYASGVAAVLLLITFLGQAAVAKLKFLSNPTGWFRRLIGILFLVVGLAVIFGLDKRFQAYVLEQGWYDPVKNLEERFTR